MEYKNKNWNINKKKYIIYIFSRFFLYFITITIKNIFIISECNYIMENNSNTFDTSEILADFFNASTSELNQFENSELNNPFNSRKNVANEAQKVPMGEKFNKFKTNVQKKITTLSTVGVCSDKEKADIKREIDVLTSLVNEINKKNRMSEYDKNMQTIYNTKLNILNKKYSLCNEDANLLTNKGRLKFLRSKSEFDDSSLENNVKYMSIDDVLNEYN